MKLKLYNSIAWESSSLFATLLSYIKGSDFSMDDIFNKATELNQSQDKELIEKMILLILKEQKVSLSQTIGIFKHIIDKIEHENPVNL